MSRIVIRWISWAMISLLCLLAGVISVAAVTKEATAQVGFLVYDPFDNTVPPYTEGQLRYVIDQVNAVPPGMQVVVEFAVGYVGLSAELMPITRGNVIIDGEYEEDSRLYLDGSWAGPATGLRITGGGNVEVRSIEVEDFQNFGVHIENSSHNRLENLGVWGAGSSGVLIEASSGGNASWNTVSDCMVGDCAFAAADEYGVKITNPDGTSENNTVEHSTIVKCGNGSGSAGGIGISRSHSNQIVACRVGLNPSEYGWGNHGWGILVQDSKHTDIRRAYSFPFTPNRIGDNALGGIWLTGDTFETRIFGNAIGTGRFSEEPWGNHGHGILVEADYTTIGAQNPGADPLDFNAIANNAGCGIMVSGDSQANAVYQNSFYNNAGPGIDLVPDPGPNFPQGTYSYPTVGEPNQFMNFPVITDAARRPDGDVQASGTALAGSRVYLYYADGDGSGFGEGRTFVDYVDVAGDGNWYYDGAKLQPDRLLTATATDMDPVFPAVFGNTSEFSENVLVGDEIPPQGSIEIEGGAHSTNSRNVTLRLTASDDYYAPRELEYQLSNQSDFSDAAWAPVPSLIGVWDQNWTLEAGNGNRTVYYRLRNNWQTSGAFSDWIFLKESKPTGWLKINGGAESTYNQDVRLGIGASDLHFPVSELEMQLSNNSEFRGAEWEEYSSNRSWRLSGGSGNKNVYLRIRDPLGNVSKRYSDSIELRAGRPAFGPAWYLAEGTTAWGFSTCITIENPNDSDMTCTVTYMPTGSTNKQEIVGLPANSQTTLTADHLSALLGEVDFSTEVKSNVGLPIAVDRTMQWTGDGAPSPDGHCSVGVAAPDKTWYLPEGSSNHGFETWLLIQNPGSGEATCTITYMVEGDDPVTVTRNVPAASRQTFSMGADIGKKDASIEVKSDRAVICERAMYRNNRREGHDSIGTTAAFEDCYLAEGTTAWGFTTYLLVQNPNEGPVQVELTYMTPTGAVPHPENPIAMPGNSRKTVRVNDHLAESDFSTRVSGSAPIIAERAMYWGAGTPLGEACHDSIGLPEPHTSFYLPDGQTTDGRETWTLVQNPNSTDVEVRVTYLTPGGDGNVTFTDTVKANSRKTFNMADGGVNGRAAAVVTCLTEGKKIMCERAMYWNDRGAGTDTIGAFAD